MYDNVILTDCDGVLLDWRSTFLMWMDRHGLESKLDHDYSMSRTFDITPDDAKRYTRNFNESASIGFLRPFRDAIFYVDLLHRRHGYVFHVITSLSDDPYACELRTQNLRRVFGESVFEKFIYLDTGADKNKALEPYQGTGCYWIEDKPENAMVGSNLGLNSILMAHSHNYVFDDVLIKRVDTWKEIYKHIIGDD